MEGLLLVNKPKEWTSFDVVAKVRGLVSNELGLKTKNVKVGHIGTLDPMASGLMGILIGKNYTRKAESLSKLDKLYEVEMLLGKKSPSYDMETELIEVSDKEPNKNKIMEIINSYIGEIDQIPPIYSALKVNGRRAYSMARNNEEVELKSRKVKVYSIKDINYKYPYITMTCEVSSGTYIRSLVADIGEDLGVGAVMSNLRRTKVGDFILNENTVSADNLNIEYIKNNLLELKI